MFSQRWLEKKISIIKYSCISNSMGQAACFISCYVFFSSRIFPNKFLWLIMGLMNSVLVLVVPYYFIYFSKRDEKKYIYANFSHNFLMVMMTLLWMYTTLNLYSIADPESKSIYSIIVAGIPAATLVTMLNSQRISMLMMIIYIIPYSIVSIMMGSTYGNILSGLSFIYLMILLLQTTIVHRLMRKEYLLSEENRLLLEKNKKNTEILLSSSKMASLGEMASSIAHEINNPLAIINGLVYRLRSTVKTKGVEPEVIHSYLDRLLATSERISGIVKGLKFFSRDGSRDEFVECDLETIIDDTLKFCIKRFQNHNIKIVRSTHAKNTKILCRPIQISQVILNLLNNSYDAICESQDKWVEISLCDRNKKLVLLIIDSGSGVPDDLQEYVMSPFFTTKEIGKGTGLGLSISQKIMKAHGGDLSLNKSHLNTCFEIVFDKAAGIKCLSEVV